MNMPHGTASVGHPWRGVFCALLLAPVTAPALDEPVPEAEGPFSEWSCRLCPEFFGWWGRAEFGSGWISDKSLRFASYRGPDQEGPYAALDGDFHFRGAQGHYVDGQGRDLGLDSREFGVRGGLQGHYEWRLAWREIPFYRGHGARTPFLGQGGTHLSLPPDWAFSRDTGGMTRLQDSLQAAPLGTQRKTMDAGLSFSPTSAWSFEVDVQRQKKNGTRSFGGAGIFINNASLLPAPVDFTTDRVDIGVNWGNDRAQVRLALTGSWFDNGRRSLTWDNPFTHVAGTEQFRAALEPENDYHQISLTGAYAFARGVHVSGHAAVGEASQDTSFLPFSINPEFGDLPLPRASLDGRVDTHVLNLGGKLSARLNQRLTFTARAKFDERDNATPVNVYTPVTADFITIEERTNRPYGFERLQYSADLRYRVHRAVHLSGGGRRLELDRTFQAVETSEETTWWGEVRLQPWSWSQLRLRGETARRDISEYRAPDHQGPFDHPLFRKFNQADRDREKVLAELFLTAANGLGFNVNIHDARDDYEESLLGLQRSEVQGFTVGLDYASASQVSVYAYVTRDDIESRMTGVNVGQSWNGDTEDRITTAGAGLGLPIGDKAQLGLDAVWADSKGEILVQAGGAERPFPPLRTTLKNIRLHLSQDIGEHWGYRLMAEYEHYDSSDWAVDRLGVDGLDPVLTFGRVSPRYSTWNLYARAVYGF